MQKIITLTLFFLALITCNLVSSSLFSQNGKSFEQLFWNKNFRAAEALLQKKRGGTKSNADEPARLFWLGRCQEQQNRYQEAMATYKQLIGFSQNKPNWEAMGWAGVLTSATFSYDSTTADAALDSLQHILSDFPNDNLYILRSQHAYFYAKSDYTKALFYSLESLKQEKKAAKDPMMALAYINLANVYQMLKEYNKAMQFYEKSLDLHQQLNITIALSNCYQALGSLYAEQQQHTKAIDYFQKSYRINRSSPNEYGQGYDLMCIASEQFLTPQWQKASISLQKALPILQKYNDLQSLGFCENLLGEIEMKKRNASQAIPHFLRANKSYQQIHYQEGVRESYNDLVEAYQANGQWQKAFLSLKQLMVVNDSITDADRLKITKELTLKYETEKKDNQIANQQVEILEKKQSITLTILIGLILILLLLAMGYRYSSRLKNKISDLKATFEVTYQQLNSFNQTVSHDLRRPLVNARNIIQAKSFQEIDNQEVSKLKNAIEEAESIIEAMLTLSRIDQKNLLLKTIDTYYLVNDIVDSAEWPPHIRFEVAPLPPLTADPLLLRQVFINLISNAVKYSVSTKQPVVRIYATTTANENTISVEDNGIGMKKEQLPNLFKPFQRFHSNISGIGLGLVVVEKIITKHKGNLEARLNPAGGMVFLFSLPRQVQ